VYANTLETLIARVHPAIVRVRVGLAPGSRDGLVATVRAPAGDHPGVMEALRRSEASFTPRGFSLSYRMEDEGRSQAVDPATAGNC
jgi:hypothetical protein